MRSMRAGTTCKSASKNINAPTWKCRADRASRRLRKLIIVKQSKSVDESVVTGLCDSDCMINKCPISFARTPMANIPQVLFCEILWLNCVRPFSLLQGRQRPFDARVPITRLFACPGVRALREFIVERIVSHPVSTVEHANARVFV